MKKKYDLCEQRSGTCIKCVLVGDSGTGKTNVAARLSSGKFREEYEPTTFGNFAVTIFIEDRPFHLSLFDTPGKEDYDRLRVMSYMKSDVFLVCFAVDDPESLKSVEEHWVPELRHYLPETPFILVGTRADRRYDETSYTVDSKPQVTYKQAMSVSSKVEAESYVECSALTNEGIQDLIKDIVDTVERVADCTDQPTGCCSCTVL